MYPTVHHPRRNESDLGAWMLALVAVLCLWGTILVSSYQLHP